MKKALTALLASALLSASAIGPGSTPARAQGGEIAVQILGDIPALRENVPSWVPLMWINEGAVDVEQFWITAAEGRDVVLAFPAHEEDPGRPYLPTPGVYSSLSNDDVLARNEIDFTALHVTVIGPDPLLDVRVSYLAPDGERVSRDLAIEVPIDDGSFRGDAVELETGELGPIPGGSIAWLDLHLTAKTSVSDVQLRVGSDAISIVYPSDAFASGLNNGSTLLEGDSDFGAVRFDTTGLEPGAYPIEVTATYKVGSLTQSTTVERVVILEG